jgi:hypothetical protein
MSIDQNISSAIELGKAAPAVTVSSLVFFGISLSDWVIILTAIYVVTQFAIFLERWIYEKKQRKVTKKDTEGDGDAT